MTVLEGCHLRVAHDGVYGVVVMLALLYRLKVVLHGRGMVDTNLLVSG